MPDNETGTLDASPPRRKLLASLVAADSYGLVLLLVVLTYLISVMLDEWWAPPLVAVMQIVTVWFALRTSQAPRRVRRAADVVLVVAIVIAVIEVVSHRAGEPSPLIVAIGAILYLVAPATMINHLGSRATVDRETVLGAVGAYLLIGMFFAFTYRFLDLTQPGPFFGSGGEGTTEKVLFFSFTTLTTTGFGNLVPAANPGQTVTVAEMLIGQLFLITAVGKVITVWRPARWSTAGPTSEAREE